MQSPGVSKVHSYTLNHELDFSNTEVGRVTLLFLFFFIVLTCVCLCVCTCMCVSKPEVDIVSLFQSFSSLVFETEFPMSPEPADPANPASIKLQGSFLPVSPALQ